MSISIASATPTLPDVTESFSATRALPPPNDAAQPSPTWASARPCNDCNSISAGMGRVATPQNIAFGVQQQPQYRPDSSILNSIRSLDGEITITGARFLGSGAGRRQMSSAYSGMPIVQSGMPVARSPQYNAAPSGPYRLSSEQVLVAPQFQVSYTPLACGGKCQPGVQPTAGPRPAVVSGPCGPCQPIRTPCGPCQPIRAPAPVAPRPCNPCAAARPCAPSRPAPPVSSPCNPCAAPRPCAPSPPPLPVPSACNPCAAPRPCAPSPPPPPPVRTTCSPCAPAPAPAPVPCGGPGTPCEIKAMMGGYVRIGNEYFTVDSEEALRAQGR